MKKTTSRLLSALLALCMVLALLPFAALAAETIKVTVTPTDIRADRVVNYEGYGSLTINGNWDEFDEWLFWDEDFLAGVANPQIALVDRNGTLLFPYIENADEFGRDWSYIYSDGIVSLAGSPYQYGDIPKYYNLDGTVAVPLEESYREEDTDGWHQEITTSYIGGPMLDGYALIAEMTSGYETSLGGNAASAWGPSPSRFQIIDKNGTVTCAELPEGLIVLDGEGPLGFLASSWVGEYCGEGLFAFCEEYWDEDSYMGQTKGKGFIDATGKTVIDLSGRGFQNTGRFIQGMAWVVDANSQVGFIDKTGALVIPCTYEEAEAFSGDGLCAVKMDGKWGYIDKTGNTVIPFEYDDAYGAGDGLASVVKDGKCGLVDYSNNVVVPLEYDDITPFDGGVAYAVKGGLLYILTKSDPTPETPDTPDTPTFTDVPADAYYAEAVNWAVEREITDGIGGNEFGSNNIVSRAQAVTFLWRAAGRPEPESLTSRFADVTDTTQWYYKAVLWAAEQEITDGTGYGMFGVDDTLPYDQMLTFMCRAAGVDTSGDWSGKAIRWAESNGLTSGLTYSAYDDCPRRDVVYILWKELA